MPNIDPWPQENLAAIKARCRQEGVSLNSLALAASQLAMLPSTMEALGQPDLEALTTLGLVIRPDGYLALDDVLSCPPLQKYQSTRAEVESIVRTSDKQCFFFTCRD